MEPPHVPHLDEPDRREDVQRRHRRLAVPHREVPKCGHVLVYATGGGGEDSGFKGGRARGVECGGIGGEGEEAVDPVDGGLVAIFATGEANGRVGVGASA